MTITWTQAQIDAMKASIARGVLSVSFGDQTVQYQSLKEMRELLATMERSVGGAPGYRLGQTNKGV